MADSILFDRGKDELAAAKESSPWYNEAQELHDAGCRLPRRQRYYLLMGQAYGALRLARTEAGYDASELRKAETPLTVASQEFPSSAEIPYTLARAYCALAQSSPGVDAKKGDPSEGDEKGEVPEARWATACAVQFERALQVAAGLERPRFLRTHRSAQDWIVRSRTQSEFEPLRRQARYGAAVKAALEDSKEPLQLTKPTDEPLEAGPGD